MRAAGAMPSAVGARFTALEKRCKDPTRSLRVQRRDRCVLPNIAGIDRRASARVSNGVRCRRLRSTACLPLSRLRSLVRARLKSRDMHHATGTTAGKPRPHAVGWMGSGHVLAHTASSPLGTPGDSLMADLSFVRVYDPAQARPRGQIVAADKAPLLAVPAAPARFARLARARADTKAEGPVL